MGELGGELGMWVRCTAGMLKKDEDAISFLVGGLEAEEGEG